MKIFLRRALPVVILLLLVAGIFMVAGKKEVYEFDQLAGPDHTDVVAKPINAALSDYGVGESSRLAILVTDPDSAWLGLAHGLRTIGVPFIVTDKPERAMLHKMVLVYPTISGKLLDKSALQALAAHPQHGGLLVGFDVLGGGLADTFGFSDTFMLRTRKLLTLEKAFAATFLMPDALESELMLSGPSGGMPTHAFNLTKGRALAHYDDGGVAMVRRDFANGSAIAVGFDIGAYVAKAYNGRQDFGRTYVNSYEPAVDTVLRMLRSLYRAAEPLGVTLSTVPEGRSASVILTHDVDVGRAINNAVVYADYIQSQDIAATFFIQTKYVRDFNDFIFFNENGASQTKRLLGKGMEVASHSVAHSPVFSTFPMGTGSEHYPDYVPFVANMAATQGGSLLGELRVSRFLLQSDKVGATVSSFRSGYLAYPFELPQALQASGYRFSSSISAGVALTHLPFQMNYNRGTTAETPIFEFPITIEDERDGPMHKRVDKAVAVLDRLRQYGGSCVVLIHPDIVAGKLAFLKDFVKQAKTRDVWFGSLVQFGSWWSDRNQVGIDVRESGADAALELTTPVGIKDLALELPTDWKLGPVQDAGINARQSGARILLTAPAGKVVLALVRS